jgi:hypothetical protein
MDQVDDSGFDSDHKTSASSVDMSASFNHPLSDDGQVNGVNGLIYI